MPSPIANQTLEAPLAEVPTPSLAPRVHDEPTPGAPGASAALAWPARASASSDNDTMMVTKDLRNDAQSDWPLRFVIPSGSHQVNSVNMTLILIVAEPVTLPCATHSVRPIPCLNEPLLREERTAHLLSFLPSGRGSPLRAARLRLLLRMKSIVVSTPPNAVLSE